MRSDFYGLPYAAQMAIRKGERAARTSMNRAYTIQELVRRNEALVEALRNHLISYEVNEHGLDHAEAERLADEEIRRVQEEGK